MAEILSLDLNQIFDGLFFGLGVLAVYLGAVITGSIIRSLGGAGGAGLLFLGKYFAGWFDYMRGDNRSTINITLNMVVDNHLKFDTIVADRPITDVWPNTYRVSLIRRAAQNTTRENPVIMFPEQDERPGRVANLLTRATVVENGKRRRVRLMRDNDYRATYSPLISLMSEKCSNDDSIDLSIGRPMHEYRFVMALTYELLHDRRARHLRVMVMWEQELLSLSETMPNVSFEGHKTRYRTLLAIAREYRAHPERFGVVSVWRPQEVAAPQRIFLSKPAAAPKPAPRERA